MNTIERFTAAYIQTALWSSNDESNEQGGYPLDRNYDASDIAPETLERMRTDCTRFVQEQASVLQAAIDTGKVVCGPDFDEWGRAGHDFWLTRNHHGAGFWDGDWPEPFGRQLTDAAHAYGEVDLYVGDDGQVRS